MNPRVLYRAASYATDARSSADAVISALTPAAWYRNATGITESGGFVSQWDDYSGNGRHLVQGTGTNQPAYSAGVLTFDGADNFMEAAYTANQPRTRYWVGKQVTWTNNEHIFNGSTANVALYKSTTTPRIDLYAGSVAAANTNLAVNTNGIVCAVFNGASSSLRVNNTAKTTGDAGGANPGGLTLAAMNGGGSGWGRITVLEFIDFAAAHDDAIQDSVITALNNALTVF